MATRQLTYLVWGILAGILVELPPGSLAQTVPETTAPMQLPAVEVREQRLGVEQIVRETSAFATVIDTSDASSRVDSVADILAESVGVQIRRFGGLGAFSTVSIRGSTPNQVEVYLDNVLLNQANAGLVDLGNLPLDNVERLEIYRGFAPLQLGAGSMGGAVHLVTRQVAGTTSNSASASYGSFDTRKFTLYRSQGFDKLGYMVLFNYTESDGDFEFLDDNGTPFNTQDDARVKRRNNDFRSFNGNAKGEAILSGWNLTLSDDVFTKDQGVPGLSSTQSETARLDLWRNVATLRLEKKAVPWASTDMSFQVSHAWEQEHFIDPQDTIGIGIQNQENTSHTLSGSGLITLHAEPWQQVFSLMIEGRHENYRTVDLRPEQRGESPLQGPLQKRNSFTVALQDEIRLFDAHLALRPLLRYQFADSDFGAQPGIGSGGQGAERQEQDHLFSPSLGVKYTLTSWLNLKGNVGHSTRIPTLFELFGDRGVTLGNPELTPEKGTNWDAGFALELPAVGIVDRMYFEYAYFAQDTEDLIVFVQNSQSTVQAQNIGAAEISGHEISWSLTALNHIRLYGNYTFQDATDTSETFSRGLQLPGRPRHELHQGLEFFADYGKLVYEFDYISHNFLRRANPIALPNDLVEARILHNLSLTVLPLGKRLKVTLEAKNITDNQVADVFGFPLPGRSFFGTVEGRF